MSHLKNKMTRITAVLLAMLMVLTVAPIIAFPASAADNDLQYRIVHLDCGREYFSIDWIIALINEMAAAGYNQLQLAFGNGGFRFYLDDMTVGKYKSDVVKAAIEAGNEHYNTYGDGEDGPTNSEWISYNPTTNALTQDEMTAIITHANEKGIEIVPMFNTPGHMHALLAAMSELGITGTLSVSNGCLNLSNEEAVGFTKALITKYVNYFATQGCNYFHLATDEYHDANGKANFTSDFYNYANSLVDIVVSAKMTPRVFNDSFKTSGTTIKKDSTYPTQVCYWFTGTNGKSASSIANDYQMINTNHDWYYVSTNEKWNLNSEGYTFVGDYNETEWIKKAQNFSNTYFYGSNVNNPAGSMFCIWCNTPGKNDETEIAKQIRMILRVIGARMQNSNSYNASAVLVDGGFDVDGNIYHSAPFISSNSDITKDETGAYKVLVNQNFTLRVSDGTLASWTVTGDSIVSIAAASVQLKASAVASANAVQVKALKKGKAVITATLEDGTELNATVIVNDPLSKDIELEVGETKTVTVGGNVTGDIGSYDENVVGINASLSTGQETISYEAVASASIEAYNSKISSDYLASKLIDGNTNTKYWSGSAQTVGAYVQVDLGAAIPFDAVRLTSCEKDICTNAKVQVSADGENWTDIGSYTGSTTPKIYENTLDKVRYIRVLITTAKKEWWQMAEIEWGSYKNGTFTRMAASGTVATETKNETAISFTGVTPGKTSVTIGGIKYNITVKKIDRNITLALTVGNTRDLTAHLDRYKNEWSLAYDVSENDGAITLDKSTVTAVKEGSAKVVVTATKDDIEVAKYTFTINVAKEDLTTKTIDIELWITDGGVVPTGWTTGNPVGFVHNDQVNKTGGKYTDKAYRTVNAGQFGFYSENGALVTEILEGTFTGIAKNKDYKSGVDVTYWKTAYHDGTAEHPRQEWVGWTNHVNDGIEFKYLRYWNDTWAYSVDGKSWTDINGEIGASETDEGGKAQINIFYRQITEVTDEVTTEIVDWGPSSSETDLKHMYYQNLDFAVKYESGEITPSTYPTLGKSIAFNKCNDGKTNTMYWYQDGSNDYRIVYGIAGINTSDYEVYMITLTPNDTTKSTGSYTYKDVNEKVIWAVDEASVPAGMTLYQDDAFYGSCKFGGEAYVEKVKILHEYSLRVTYYVRAKQTDTALRVHYVDKMNNNEEFYNFSIAVGSNTTFGDVRLPETKIDGKTALTNGRVENKQGVYQYVSSKLSTLPEIAAKYLYAEYTCVEVTLSEDKTELWLYYQFNYTHKFVIDFGSPITISASDIGLMTANWNDSKVFAPKYGTATLDKVEHTLTYKPTTILKDVELVTLNIIVNNETEGSKTVTHLIYIYPASTVYYEDGFIEFDDSWKTTTTEGGTSATDRTQGTHELGAAKGDNDIRYGYDSSYGNDATFSAGSAHVVTVTSNSPYATAKFTFTGTGFDLVSLTSNKTGAIFIDVFKGSTTEGNPAYRWVVDTYYGYTREQNGYLQCTWTKDAEGKWHVTKKQIKDLPEGATVGGTPSKSGDVCYEYNYVWTAAANTHNALYQIPVISKRDLAHGEYTVVVTAKYYGFFDHNEESVGYDIYVDGVRIYNTLGDGDEYKDDGEAYPEFIEVRDILIEAGKFTDGATSATGVVYIDGSVENGTTSVEDFKYYGPNNEVYLTKGNSIAFRFNASEFAKVQIGLKAPNGATSVTVTVGDKSNTYAINTATDMYYLLEGVANGSTVVITNNGEGILSITTLKITHAEAPASATMLTVDADVIAEANAVMLSLIQPEIPVFTPELLEASWTTVKLFRRSVHTLTVRTSADVDHITVDGKEITDFYYSVILVGSGWNRKLVKCKMFTVTYGDDARLGDYDIVAFNAEGVASEPHKSTLTGKPGVGKFN